MPCLIAAYFVVIVSAIRRMVLYSTQKMRRIRWLFAAKQQEYKISEVDYRMGRTVMSVTVQPVKRHPQIRRLAMQHIRAKLANEGT